MIKHYRFLKAFKFEYRLLFLISNSPISPRVFPARNRFGEEQSDNAVTGSSSHFISFTGLL